MVLRRIVVLFVEEVLALFLMILADQRWSFLLVMVIKFRLVFWFAFPNISVVLNNRSFNFRLMFFLNFLNFLGLVFHLRFWNHRFRNFLVQPVVFILSLPRMFDIFSVIYHNLAIDQVLFFSFFWLTRITAYFFEIFSNSIAIDPSSQFSHTFRYTLIYFEVCTKWQSKERFSSASELVN